MIRHIFIATFKKGLTEDVKQKELADMIAMKDHIPAVSDLKIGFSKGWAGAENQIVMTVDFESKEKFDDYMKHPYHIDYIDQTGREYFDVSSFSVAQFEF